MFASNTFSHTTLKVLLCLLVLVWTSCSTPKEEPQGEIGPEGPKGPKGPDGGDIEFPDFSSFLRRKLCSRNSLLVLCLTQKYLRIFFEKKRVFFFSKCSQVLAVLSQFMYTFCFQFQKK